MRLAPPSVLPGPGILAALAAAGLLLAGPVRAGEEPGPAAAAQGAQVAHQLMRPWTGDLDGMRKRGVVRALVVYSRTGYFVERGTQRGASYELLKAFEAELNAKAGPKGVRLNLVFIPVARDELIPALLEGRGDLAAAHLTITPERSKRVAFSDPLYTGVSEVVVTGPAGPRIATVDDLAGRAIHLRRSSSYWEHLVTLNQRLVQAGKVPVKLIPASEELEDEDLLEMANAGLLGIVVVDRHIARFWKQIFTKLVLEPEVAISSGDEIGWMFRKDSPGLQQAVNAFVRTHRQGTAFGNETLQRYFKDAGYLKEATSRAEQQKFQATVDLFRKYAGQYQVDYLLMMAQGYQESRLDQQAKSQVGAVGVMQLMPETGKQMAVGDITQLEPNIHAGVKYLRYVQDTYFADEPMDPLVKALFAFASYNAGPGRIHGLRKEAARRGLDPNRWFRNVEYVAAEKVGRETVTYVANIFRYYIAYRLVAEQAEEREQAVEQMEHARP